MTSANDRERLDRRMEEASRLMREHRLLVDPEPHFADRVVARLSRDDGWMFAWAARRVLPVTLTVAAMLMVAVLFVERSVPAPSAASAISSTPQQTNDPLDWLLGNGQGVQ